MENWAIKVRESNVGSTQGVIGHCRSLVVIEANVVVVVLYEVEMYRPKADQ